jgi:hypothetical protein
VPPARGLPLLTRKSVGTHLPRVGAIIVGGLGAVGRRRITGRRRSVRSIARPSAVDRLRRGQPQGLHCKMKVCLPGTRRMVVKSRIGSLHTGQRR